jgi:endonuclease/exonuclease/phosphatase family metal-dependent hydrolase
MKWIPTAAAGFIVVALGTALFLLGRGEPEGAEVGEPRSLGSFNIRFFPGPDTDPDLVAQRVAEMNADTFAVQEIVDPEAFEEMLRRASALTGRDYRFVLGRYCREWNMLLGVVWDAERYTLEQSRERAQLDPEGIVECGQGYPPAMLAVLVDREGSRLPLMSIHFQCCGEAWQHQRRRQEWGHLLESLPKLEEELGAAVVVAGDFNSVGFDDNEGGERDFIDEELARAGRRVTPADLPCTEYWQPPKAAGDFAVSALDHILVRAGEEDEVSGAGRAREAGEMEVLGMCRALKCEALAHDDFEQVSDHCPVALAGP